MARLTHNDYLEPASDSGVIGFMAFTLFVVGGLVWSFPRGAKAQNSAPHPGPLPIQCGEGEVQAGQDPRQSEGEGELGFSLVTWLRLMGGACQCLLELGLYSPAPARPALCLV